MLSDVNLGTDQTDQTDRTLLLHRVLVDGFGCAETIPNRNIHTLVDAADEHRCSTSVGERIRKHHAPREPIFGVASSIHTTSLSSRR